MIRPQRKRILAGRGVRKTALTVARELGILLLKRDTRFVARPNDLIINWGSSDARYEDLRNIVNKPSAVELASSKMATMLHLSNNELVDVLSYTQNIEQAKRWQEEGNIIVARDLDRGNSGRGITIYQMDDEVQQHLFYTKYFKARDEYRIHVANTKDDGYRIIDVQRKSLRTDEERPENPSFLIRNHSNGFIFERGAVETSTLSPLMLANAANAVMGLGLDFGAVDIRYNADTQQSKILEVNTAPGLSGTTLTKYIEHFQENWL